MPEVIKLPIIKMNDKSYFVDERLGELRNVENPHDKIPLDEAFVVVHFKERHLVPNDPEKIAEARKELRMGVRDAYEYEEIDECIDTEPAPAALVHEYLEHLLTMADELDPLIDEYDYEDVAMLEDGQIRTNRPCPDCGREEDGKWYDPCPSDDCPSHDKE